MIYILHPQKDVVLGYLDRQDYWGDEHRQGLDGVHFIQFTTFSDTPEAAMLVDRCRLLRQASTGGWQEFVAYHIEVREDRTKQVIATGAEQDLDRLKIMEPGWRSGFTLQQYVAEALAGSGVQIGIIDYGGSKSRNFDAHMGAYSFLRRVAELYDRELRRRVEVEGNSIVGRYIDLVERIGSDKPHEIVAGENMIGIERKVYSDLIVTALYCVGPEREDGTRLTVLVTDDEAFQRWNWKGQHIIDLYEPQTEDDEMTLDRLTTLGNTELKKRIDSVVEYTIEATVFEDDDVQLGDTLRIKDEGFVPPLYAEARAVFVKEPISGETYQKTYTVGEIKELKKEEVLRTFRELQKRYGTRVIKSPTAPPGARNVIWIQTETETGMDVAHTWSGTIWVSVTPVHPEQVGAEPKIPIGSTPPDPAVSKKWVDTSGLLTELKMWNETTQTWDTVQGPPGADGVDGQDGYTPVKGTDYFDGVDGQDGTDGTSSYMWIRYAQVSSGSGMVDSPTNAKYIGVATTETAIAPTDPAAYRWTLIKGIDGVPGEPGTDGKSSYLHIKYSNDGGATFTASSGEAVGDWIGTYVDFTLADSNSPSAYTWNKVKGEKGDTGSQGLQGIQGPQGDQGIAGATGADGRTSYTHIAYSTSPTGSTGFSVSDPAGKAYIGMYTDFIAADSSDPAKYAWSLIKGADGSQGIPGTKGTDGQTPYLHIAYATNATGTAGFDTVVSTGKTYIGTYTDFVSADSADPAKYSWSLIKGEKGDTGATGSQGIPGPVGPTGATLYTWLKYADSPTTGMSDLPAGKKYMGIAYNKTSPTESNTYADYAWSLVEGQAGATGNQGIPGPAGANGQPTYTWIKYGTSSTGGTISDLPAGKTYIGIAYNKTTPTESALAADYAWSLLQGPQGVQGSPGATGPVGPQGPNIVNSTTVIEADVIKANHVDVANLSAISANLGTITAGDINGATMNLGDGKFRVDSLGNVTFSGNLVGASGSFKGALTSGDGASEIRIEYGTVYGDGHALFDVTSVLPELFNKTVLGDAYGKIYTHQLAVPVSSGSYAEANFVEVTMPIANADLVAITRILGVFLQSEAKEWYAYERADGRTFTQGELTSLKVRISPQYGYTSGGTTVSVNVLIVGAR